MHKTILHSIPQIQENRSSFSYLFSRFKSWQTTPNRWIALYEEYLKPFCVTDTKEVFQCLCFAGETYRMIGDSECALECYQKALDMNVNNKYEMNNGIQKQMKILKKPSKTIRTMNNESARLAKDIDKEVSAMHDVQEEEWSIYWNMNGSTTGHPSIKLRLEGLSKYLINREEWYDGSDAKIILRLPYGKTPNLTIEDYYSNVLVAVHQHISSINATTDATNNRFLSLWHYGKYMHEWTLFKTLEQFLQPFQGKRLIRSLYILSRLKQLLKKLSVLITLCTVYICIEQGCDKVNVDNLPFINLINTKTRQLIFFDLHDTGLLADLQALEETTEQITVPVLDEIIGPSMEISDFIEKKLYPT